MKIKRFWFALLCILFIGITLSVKGVIPSEVETNALAGVSAQLSQDLYPDPSYSVDLAKETGVYDALVNTGLSGSGVKVGLVDTGVDVGTLLSGTVSDWIDLTAEGTVITGQPVSPGSTGLVPYGGSLYQTRGIVSKSGEFRMGTWTTDNLPQGSPLLGMLSSGASFDILVVDSHIPGYYDTVYIDTDKDKDFSKETPMEVFRDSQVYVSIKNLVSDLGPFNLVVSDIRDNGQRIILGFDGHGHGTSVASVISGAYEGFMPMAPGSTLTVVKALDSSGRTRMDLLAQGVIAACESGANIVVLSVAPIDTLESSTYLADAFEKAGKQYGALIVMASGNTGPGIGTISPYTGFSNVMLVGGYIPKAASDILNLSGGSIWPWTSIGPCPQGRTVSVLAPAISVSLNPMWKAQYLNLFEGTSCSAAYLGAVAALVSEAQINNQNYFDALDVRQSLEQGAVMLNKYGAVEQGHGVLDLTQTLDVLGSTPTAIRAVFDWNGRYMEGGFFDRNRIPGQIPYIIDNFTPIPVSMELDLPWWLVSRINTLSVPAVDQKEGVFQVQSDLSPGLYSYNVKGDDPGVPGMEMEFLVTSVVPRVFRSSGYLGIQKIINAGFAEREYFRIPKGLEFLFVTLEVDVSHAGNPRGRVRMFIYDDAGRLVDQNDWIGEGTQEIRTEIRIDLPNPGVWEIVVVSDPVSPQYDAGDAVFNLGLYCGGIAPLAGEKDVPWVYAAAGQTLAQGQVTLTNLGETFNCRSMLVHPGTNGSVSVERLVVGNRVSLAKSLPEIPVGAGYLYVGVSDALEDGVDLDIYLYHFNTATGRWVEISSSARKGVQDESIFLANPDPGQYIAYIEASNMKSLETSFKWTSFIVRDTHTISALDTRTGRDNYVWEHGADVDIDLSIPALSITPDNSKMYLVLWDSRSNTLKNLLTIDAGKEMPVPLIYVGKGISAEGKTIITINARDPNTMLPINAMVCVDGMWHQLYRGQATVTINKDSSNDVSIIAEYDGFYDRRKTISE